MSLHSDEFSRSTFSLAESVGSQTEDWDRSDSAIDPTLDGAALAPEAGADGAEDQNATAVAARTHTPRNSVAFPASVGETPRAGRARLDAPEGAGAGSRRTLSELLRLHAEKGTDVSFSVEEAGRVADVLGQWINSGCSPYEAEDDFFARAGSQDDAALRPKRVPSGAFDATGRPRGQSDSCVVPRQQTPVASNA